MDDKEFHRLVGSMDLIRPHVQDLAHILKEEAKCLHFSQVDQRRIDRAFRLAFWAHRHTPPRNSGEAYIFHPFRMAIESIRDQYALGLKNGKLIEAILLHDVLEEAHPSGLAPMIVVRAIIFFLGKFLARGVYLLTKRNGDSDTQYWMRLVRSILWIALIAKLYDRIDNVRTLGVLPKKRQIAKIRETEQHVTNLVRRIRRLILKSGMSDRYRSQHLKLVTKLERRLRVAVNERKYTLQIS